MGVSRVQEILKVPSDSTKIVVGSAGCGRTWVNRSYVSGLELGQRNPTVVTLWHIDQALGVKLRLFFEEEKSGRRPR